jgi:hypothetical protein
MRYVEHWAIVTYDNGTRIECATFALAYWLHYIEQIGTLVNASRLEAQRA